MKETDIGIVECHKVPGKHIDKNMPLPSSCML